MLYESLELFHLVLVEAVGFIDHFQPADDVRLDPVEWHPGLRVYAARGVLDRKTGAVGPEDLSFERIRCAALVGANPANFGLPRSADVFPVTMIAPSPAFTIAGASRRAR